MKNLKIYLIAILIIAMLFLVSAKSYSNVRDSWDWRNVHGENWMPEIRNQRTPDYDGNIKSTWCGSCWVFGVTGATEIAINLFYNQHLDVHLSEEQSVCAHKNGCSGGKPTWTLNELKKQD
jgi:hypothetical protein